MIYLDHNATTPLDARVLDAMLPYLREQHGNASSGHRIGRAARDAVETARGQVAALVGADPGEVLFTSGGTEANNLAVKGVAATAQRGRLLCSAIEHPCVLEPMKALAAWGWGVETIAVDAEGRVDFAAFEQQLAGGNVRLASCMTANNETGVLQDIGKLARASRAAGTIFHTDAVQAAGKVALNFPDSGAQLMTLSAHKIYGPKGCGALIADRGVDLAPLLHGGGQEKNLRGGTENVAAIVGFGEAAALAADERQARAAHAGKLRDRLQARLAMIPGLVVFSTHAQRLPNTLQFAVPGVHSATLLGLLDKKSFAVSSGSACATGTDEASHVLLAMGVPQELALGAIRVSFGKDNREADADAFASVLADTLAGLGKEMPAMARA
jgi:cysteine desulfurase